MVRRRRLTRSSRRRERYEWLGFPSVAPTVVAAGVQTDQVLASLSTLEEFPGGRLERIILDGFFSPATAPVAATGYGIFCALHLPTTQGAFPATYDPESAEQYNWLWWSAVFPQIGGTAVADSNASRWMGYIPFHVDIRPRRRYGDLGVPVFSVKNSAGSGASIQFSFAVRLLFAAGAR
jgi:hypothetical protein